MKFDKVIEKTPKPVLLILVLCLAIALFIYTDPIRNECAVKIEKFELKTAGILTATKINKKIQFAKLDYAKDFCKEGNSIGSCNQYFDNLRILAFELKNLGPKCVQNYLEKLDEDSGLEGFVKKLSLALRIMALAAWGNEPPIDRTARAGWLNEGHLKTFCSLKNSFIQIAGSEALDSAKARVFAEYPDRWSDEPVYGKLLEQSKTVDEGRPRAFKTSNNPKGSLSKSEVYERSLFSIRCDLYL